MDIGKVFLSILNISLAKLTLYVVSIEDHRALLSTSDLGISHGQLKINFAALQCKDSNAIRPSLLVRPPQTVIPYIIDG